MSNYPPTPSFGGPFSVASRIPSSSSVAGHNDSQRYQGVTNTLHMPQEAQSKATTNTYPFGQNAQAMNFEGFGSGVPPPFLSLARFPPGSLPPPPFPPVPIPQNGFPAQFSIPSRRADLLPNPPQNIKVQQTKNLHLPPRPNADYSAQRSLAATSEGEREEGELSDMEVKDTTGYGIQVSGPQSEHQPPSPKFALNQSSQIGSYAGENNTRPREQDNSLTFRRPEEPRTVGENSRERRGSGSCKFYFHLNLKIHAELDRSITKNSSSFTGVSYPRSTNTNKRAFATFQKFKRDLSRQKQV